MSDLNELSLTELEYYKEITAEEVKKLFVAGSTVERSMSSAKTPTKRNYYKKKLKTIKHGISKCAEFIQLVDRLIEKKTESEPKTT